MMSALSLDQALADASRNDRLPATVELWTVSASAGNLVTVVNATQTLTFPYLRSYRISGSSPVAGDVVLVLRAGSAGWVLGAFGPQPGSPTPPKPVTPPSNISGTATFLPNYTGSYRAGAWRTDTSSLYQGDYTGRGINTGGAYYGFQAKGLAGSTVGGVSVAITRGDGGAGSAQAPTLVLLGNAGPSAAPNVLASQAGPAIAIGARATVTLPNSWGDQLIAGTADGIGIYVNATTPYIQVLGRNADASAVALTINWSKPG
jgi:hypothetical protein